MAQQVKNPPVMWHGFDSWVWKIPWSTKWQPAPVFLPGKFHGQKSLADYSPWGLKDSDMTEWLSTAQHLYNPIFHWPQRILSIGIWPKPNLSEYLCLWQSMVLADSLITLVHMSLNVRWPCSLCIIFELNDLITRFQQAPPTGHIYPFFSNVWPLSRSLPRNKD